MQYKKNELVIHNKYNVITSSSARALSSTSRSTCTEGFFVDFYNDGEDISLLLRLICPAPMKKVVHLSEIYNMKSLYGFIMKNNFRNISFTTQKN